MAETNVPLVELQNLAQCPSTLQNVSRIPFVEAIEKSIGLNNEPNHIINKLNNLEVSKKKRRSRPAKKKIKAEKTTEKQADGCSLSDFLSTFKITAVRNQTASKVIRIKNGTSCRHINIKFFHVANKTETPTDAVASTSNNTPLKDEPVKSFNKTKKGRVKTGQPKKVVDKLKLQSPIKLPCSSPSSKLADKPKSPKKQKLFEPHWDIERVQEGLSKQELVKGAIRINSKNFSEAYVSNVDSSEQDYCIPTIVDRNRALEGDIVAIQPKQEESTTGKSKTATVVYIFEQVHLRIAIGSLRVMPENRNHALLIPRDYKIPRIRIPINKCPAPFVAHPNRFENILFKVAITKWDMIKYAMGMILGSVGAAGDLESETNALIVETGLNVTPFAPSMMQYTSVSSTVLAKELGYRKDFRKECIFTIDPLTARDLDDAVSCRELENGNLEVGVHISDVAHFLTEGTVLDSLVSKKATTVYLVNNVYHMLPQELCMHCSLLPGRDKLAFSVVWEMTKDGEIISHRFTRSVINSCVQLSYEHAQKMIENPDHQFTDDELPQIHGGFTYKDLSRIVNHLQRIAVNLRTQRFERGALRIDQTKLIFRLDHDTGEPIDCLVYENKEANRLIEEFMLLANISVARRIRDDFPGLAFLRKHEPPNSRMLNELKKNLEEYDVQLDISNSKTIQQSIWKAGSRLEFGKSQVDVLNHLLAKPMKRALYFCAANAESEAEFHHYALHLPIYTHFTSPIRRYADIMVHRLLSASLGYSQKPGWSNEHVTEIANNCNKQKYNAKIAGELSSDLYLAYYVGEHQPFIKDAVVIDVKNKHFDVLVTATGTIHQIFFGNLIEGGCKIEKEENVRKAIITFAESEDSSSGSYMVRLFSVVKVALTQKTKSYKLDVKLLRPVVSCSFEASGSQQS